MPVMNGIQRSSNHVTVNWDGPPGYYELLEKPTLKSSWQALGRQTNLARTATITGAAATGFFGVLGPAPVYAGSQACAECHQGVHASVLTTPHTQAFAALTAIGQGSNPACLPCHTVGYRLPTGFLSQKLTPQLAGVQCENCHGPAANHAANAEDISVRPRVEVAAAVCGGCHTGPQQPTYEEWLTSEHATVTQPNMNASTCGRCHVGPARISMVNGQTVAQNDNHLGIVCATCHDLHRTHTYTNVLRGTFSFTNLLTGQSLIITNTELGTHYTNQVRNPLASTKDYFMGPTDTFSTKYDPSINICAQCHNHSGASWTNSAAPPHRSLQYNMLLGTVGQFDAVASPNFPGAHSRLEKQCVACHMQTASYQSGPPAVAAVTGHTFRVDSFEVCAQCHKDAATAQGLVSLAQQATLYYIQQVKAELDLWATTKAPASLSAKYGSRSWEYSTPGQLSPGGSGPNTSEQSLLPVPIQKARFNLYLVISDGSYGVHNPQYAIALLEQAYTWVEDALDQ